MALKDRFNILDIETEQENVKEQVIQQTLEEADLGPVFDELAGSLSQKVASTPVWFEYSESEQRKLISDFLINKLENEYSDISFSNEEKEHIISLFMSSVHGFGALDCYIAREDVSRMFVNSDGSIFLDGGNGLVKEDAMLSTVEFDKIYSGISGRIKSFNGALSQIRLNKLVVTIFEPPVCEKKILFEKLKTDKVDFAYLINDGSINNEIFDFIKSLIEQKKNILVCGSSGCGKTAFLSALSRDCSVHSRCAIFENYPILNCDNSDRYFVKGLKDNELSDLVSAAAKLKYDYTINDTESLSLILNEDFSKGYCASLDSGSLTQAVTKLAGYQLYNEKCSEKQAKAFVASRFDYILLLEKSEASMFKISSIVDLSLNKAGSLVLTEILKYSEGAYWYNFSDEN